MEYKPHDYQQFAINYILEHPIAAVILGMGLGKTSITLTDLLWWLTGSNMIYQGLCEDLLRKRFLLKNWILRKASENGIVGSCRWR